MWILSRTFLQAFGIVCCTSANVVFIARGQIGHAFITGSMISYIWWYNARTAVHTSGRWTAVAYALGAGTGTVTGMWIARLL